MTDEPPRLTVAAENDEATIRRQQALDQLPWPCRELVANLLRVMRGAGRPLDLPDQIIELALAIQDAGKVTNAWYIGQAIEEVLHDAPPKAFGRSAVESAEHTISRGVIQVLASNLLSQRAQTAAGEREMHQGVEELQEAWEESRRRWREEMAAYRAKPEKRAQVARKVASEAGQVPTRPRGRKPSTAEAMRKRKRELREP